MPELEELSAEKFRVVDKGRAIEFEEGVWENAVFTDYTHGYPIFTRRP